MALDWYPHRGRATDDVFPQRGLRTHPSKDARPERHPGDVDIHRFCLLCRWGSHGLCECVSTVFSYQGLLCGMGCFMTGVILHFRPKIICGIIASALSAVPLFLQGDLWPWQMFIASLIAVISLIIPGHLFRRYVKQTRTK